MAKDNQQAEMHPHCKVCGAMYVPYRNDVELCPKCEKAQDAAIQREQAIKRRNHFDPPYTLKA